MRHAHLLALLAVLFFAHCAPRTSAQAPMTTIYVVRHAEKLDPTDPDTPLSPAGEERAQALSSTLAKAGVQRVYATTRKRTQQTVAPLAALRRLEVEVLEPGAVEQLVARIKTEDVGRVVLVAGHNNTVPTIVQALSGKAIDGIPEERFDRLFKVTIAPDGATTLEELRYGAPTP